MRRSLALVLASFVMLLAVACATNSRPLLLSRRRQRRTIARLPIQTSAFRRRLLTSTAPTSPGSDPGPAARPHRFDADRDGIGCET
jgi:hypothetical protein